MAHVCAVRCAKHVHRWHYISLCADAEVQEGEPLADGGAVGYGVGGWHIAECDW